MTMASSVLLVMMMVLLYCMATEVPLRRIAFGSCNDQSRSQEYWRQIIALKPDIWVWGGDIIYADKMVFPLFFAEATEEVLSQKYNAQKTNEEYQKLLDLKISVLGIWDDHDYGLNDGGADVKIKEKSKEQILKFLDVSEDGQQFQHRGIYASYTYGPEGKRVKIFLLDVRYFRTSTDVLGPEQWEWLEKELRHSHAQVNLLMSGSQVLGVDALYRETWDPKSMQRLLTLIASSKASGVILLSGDIHYAETLMTNCYRLNYPLYEFTASGLTHAVGDIPFGTFLIESSLSRWHLAHQTGRNFGIIDISWDSDEPEVWLQSRSTVTGEIVFGHNILLHDIQYDESRERTDSEACYKPEDIGFAGWKRISKKSIILAAMVLVVIVGVLIRTVVFPQQAKEVKKD